MAKLKPYYIVLKYNLNHKGCEWRRGKNPYQIVKEYDQDFLYDSPIYEVIAYFDTKKEASNFINK